MAIDRYIQEEDLDQMTHPHAAPRRYSRQAASNTIRHSPSESEYAVMLSLSLVTCVVAFLLVYSGWKF